MLKSIAQKIFVPRCNKVKVTNFGLQQYEWQKFGLNQALES